jgi:hypothetical protein
MGLLLDVDDVDRWGPGVWGGGRGGRGKWTWAGCRGPVVHALLAPVRGAAADALPGPCGPRARRLRAVAQARGEARHDDAALLHRRALLAAGITQAFRLPATPGGIGPDQATPAAAGPTDAVFLTIMALPKGRRLLGRALRVLLPLPAPARPQAQQQQGGGAAGGPPASLPSPALMLWAALRNAAALFRAPPAAAAGGGDASPAARTLAAATSQLARGMASALSSLKGLEPAADCALAFIGGAAAGAGPDGLLPLARDPALAAPAAGGEDGKAAPAEPWLGEVLTALMVRAGELMRGEGAHGQPPAAHREAWQAAYDALYALLLRHMGAVQAAQASGALSQPAARALTCVGLLKAMLMHASNSQCTQLQALVSA